MFPVQLPILWREAEPAEGPSRGTGNQSLLYRDDLLGRKYMTNQNNTERTTRVLVVDDHALTREMVCSILRSIGFARIETADNGQNALVKMRDRHFDAVVCDWNMPTMTGIQFLRAVREEPAYAKTPFLMLTAEAYKENITEAMKAGVSDYVVKPFTASILEEKIIRLVDEDAPAAAQTSQKGSRTSEVS